MKGPSLPAVARLATSSLLSVAVIAALAIAPGAAARRTQNEVVTVGAILDLADGWMSLGRASRVTLRLAAADANAALARRGAALRVRVQIVDAKGKPAVALRQLRRFASSGVRLVIG